MFGGFVQQDRMVLTQLLGNKGVSLRGLDVRMGSGLGGRTLLERRPRLTADCGASRAITHDYDQAALAEGIQQVEQSLRRLRTDRIDLYYAHFPDPNTPLEQTLAVYDDLIRQGKLRYVALSNHPAWQMAEALWIADDRRLASAPVAAQVMYSLLDRSVERELGAACVRFGLSVVPYAPLHGGLLADLSVLDRPIAGGKRYGGPGFTESEIAVARKLDCLAREWGLGMQQVSLAWLLSRPAVAELDYLRTDGHGCNGRQGQFIARLTVADKSDQQEFNFDSDGGLALGDPKPTEFTGLLSQNSDGSYTYTVYPASALTETVEPASALTGA